MDAYATQFRKAISKAKMGNLLPAQMQVMDFVAGLRPELAIITNGSNPADLDEAEETAKNVKSTSLINKNVIAAAINPATAEVKKLKAQILELKLKSKKQNTYLERIGKSLKTMKEIGNPLTEDSTGSLWIKGTSSAIIMEKRITSNQNIDLNQRNVLGTELIIGILDF